jgi:hypothetical protein
MHPPVSEHKSFSRPPCVFLRKHEFDRTWAKELDTASGYRPGLIRPFRHTELSATNVSVPSSGNYNKAVLLTSGNNVAVLKRLILDLTA